jgi:hypothetical protein
MSDRASASPPCALCLSTDTRRLDFLSMQAPVDYYRCSACGNLWREPKKKLEATSPDGTPHQRSA